MARFPIRELLRLRSTTCPKPISFSSQLPNPSTLLHTCRSLRHLFQIQAHLIASDRFQNPFLASQLLKQASHFGWTDYTLLIFHHVEFPDTVCVNTVIKAYANSLSPGKGVVLYFRMLGSDSFYPNSFTFTNLIRCCSKAECFDMGVKCHGQAVKNGVDSELHVANSLVHMYGMFGVVEVARQLFDEMCDRDVVSWNSMMDGYARLGQMDAVWTLFDEMPVRNEVSLNVMIGGCLRSGSPGRGLKMFRMMMEQEEVRWSDTTLVLVLTACSRSKRLKEGRSVHARFVRLSENWNVLLDTALIDLYSKCQRVDVARGIFNRMPYRNLVSWNAMILGHCIHGNPEDGLFLFDIMINGVASVDKNNVTNGIAIQGQEFSPDETTYIAVLCACARAGLLEEGRDHFKHMVEVWNIKPNFAHYWCMANIYAYVGLAEEAKDTLHNMPEISEDLSSQSLAWASILTSCRFSGNVSFASQVGYSLIDLEPENSLCYAFLLNIYAVAGQWDNVARIMDQIKQKKIGILPGCSLLDLKQIVHNFTVEMYEMEELTNMIRRQAKVKAEC